MICSIRVAPRPPYSFGHEIPAHPASASFFSHARENSSRSSKVFGSLNAGVPHPAGRLSRIHVRISPRNFVSSGLKARSIVARDSMRGVVASAYRVSFSTGWGSAMDRGERVQLAKDLSAGFVDRHGESIVATGIRGSVARQEDVEQSNLNMVVVTSSPDVAVSRALLYGPIAVELYVVDQRAYLEDAHIIGPWWPVRADQFSHHLALHDPNEFWRSLRAAYEEAMTAQPDDEFLRAETANIAQAVSWAYKARAAAGNS